MKICFYCNENSSVDTRYGEPICTKCVKKSREELRIILPPENQDDKKRALRLKLLLAMDEICDEGICYYCDESGTTGTLYSKPICSACEKESNEIECIQSRRGLKEDALATQLKWAISVGKRLIEDGEAKNCCYCNENEATDTKYGEPICQECKEKSSRFRAISPSEGLSEQAMALRLKLMFTMAEKAREARKR